VTSNSGPSLRERALGYLARREYSRQELARKLASYTEDGDEIAAVLDDFQKRGWLSDERFSEQVVQSRKGRYGSLKVAYELRQKGISDSLTEKAVATMAQDELENARAVWQKKFGEAPKNREEWAKQARFLQGRGFGFDTIKRVLNSDPEEL
jgi:regulatory protein